MFTKNYKCHKNCFICLAKNRLFTSICQAAIREQRLQLQQISGTSSNLRTGSTTAVLNNSALSVLHKNPGTSFTRLSATSTRSSKSRLVCSASKTFANTRDGKDNGILKTKPLVLPNKNKQLNINLIKALRVLLLQNNNYFVLEQNLGLYKASRLSLSSPTHTSATTPTRNSDSKKEMQTKHALLNAYARKTLQQSSVKGKQTPKTKSLLQSLLFKKLLLNNIEQSSTSPSTKLGHSESMDRHRAQLFNFSQKTKFSYKNKKQKTTLTSSIAGTLCLSMQNQSYIGSSNYTLASISNSSTQTLKKPFVSYWLLPLVGFSFLISISGDANRSLKAPVSNPSFNVIDYVKEPQQIAAQQKQVSTLMLNRFASTDNPLKEDLQTSFLSQATFQKTHASSRVLAMQAKGLSSKELEQLALFYLQSNLTSVNSSSESLAQAQDLTQNTFTQNLNVYSESTKNAVTLTQNSLQYKETLNTGTLASQELLNNSKKLTPTLQNAEQVSSVQPQPNTSVAVFSQSSKNNARFDPSFINAFYTITDFNKTNFKPFWFNNHSFFENTNKNLGFFNNVSLSKTNYATKTVGLHTMLKDNSGDWFFNLSEIKSHSVHLLQNNNKKALSNLNQKSSIEANLFTYATSPQSSNQDLTSFSHIVKPAIFRDGNRDATHKLVKATILFPNGPFGLKNLFFRSEPFHNTKAKSSGLFSGLSLENNGNAQNLVLVSGLNSQDSQKGTRLVLAQKASSLDARAVSYTQALASQNSNLTPITDYKYLSLVLDKLTQHYNWDFLRYSSPFSAGSRDKASNFQSLINTPVNLQAYKLSVAAKDAMHKHTLNKIPQQNFVLTGNTFGSIFLNKNDGYLSNIKINKSLKKVNSKRTIKRSLNYSLDSTFSFFHSQEQKNHLKSNSKSLNNQSKGFTHIKLDAQTAGSLASLSPEIAQLSKTLPIQTASFFATKPTFLSLKTPIKKQYSFAMQSVFSGAEKHKQELGRIKASVLQPLVEHYLTDTKPVEEPSIFNLSSYTNNILKFIKHKIAYVRNSQPESGVLGKESNMVAGAPSKSLASQNSSKKVNTTQLSKILQLTKLQLGSDSITSTSQPKMSVHNPYFTKPVIHQILTHKKFHKQSLKTFNLLVAKEYKKNASAVEYITQYNQGKSYLEHKQDLQKKSKAKRQRLETRFQKKRKRFHPRSIWFKLRLGYSFSERAQHVSFKGFIKPENRYLHLLFNKTNGLSPWENAVNNATANKVIENLGLSSTKINLSSFASLATKQKSNVTFGSTHTDKNQVAYTTDLQQKARERSGQLLSLTKTLNRSSKKAYTNNLLLNSQDAKILIKYKNRNSKYYAKYDAKTPLPPQKKESRNLLRTAKFKFWVWLYNLTNKNAESWAGFNNNFILTNILNNVSIPIDLSFISHMDVYSSYSDYAKLHASSLESLAKNGLANNGLAVLEVKATQSANHTQKSQKQQFLYKKGIAFNSNPKHLTRMQWALNKTNLWTNHNKRFDLWSSQKLRNQSRNNKTKFIEKQLKNHINIIFSNAYLKTFLNTKQNSSLPEISERFKQNLKTFTVTEIPSKTSGFKFYISQKLHSKEQKLSYFTNLNSYKTRQNQKQLKTRLISLHTNNKSQAAAYNISISSGTQISKPVSTTNFTWYKRAGLDLFGSNGSSAIQGVNSQNSIFTQTGKTLQNYSFSVFTLLFHFSALISLVSISQIRSFLQFHLILINKLANIYLKIIQKNYQITTGFVSLANQCDKNNSSKMFVNLTSGLASEKTSNPFHFGAELSKTYKKLLNSKQRDSSNKTSVGANGSGSMPSLLLNKKVQSKSSLISGVKNNYSNSFKRNLLLKSSLNKTYKTSIRTLVESFILKTLSKVGTPIATTATSTPLNVMPTTEIDSTGLHKKENTGFQNLLVKYKNLTRFLSLTQSPENFKTQVQDKNNVNKVGIQTLEEKSAKLAYKEILIKTLMLSYLSTKNYILNLNLLRKQNLNVIVLSNQNRMKEYSKTSFNKIKKVTFDSGYKIVDSFEACLRLVYSFFEKPAQFTTDWVAYAFLVEWSSDMLAFVPENNSKKTWVTFSKVARQNKNFGLWLSLSGVQTGYGAMLQNNPIYNIYKFVWFTTLGQFVYKRILYLNDIFLEILNRPDSDLISRQRKGTLFWDIWSDVLIKAADKFNINVPALASIKEEQNLLIDRFLTSDLTGTPNTSDSSLNTASSSTGIMSEIRGVALKQFTNHKISRPSLDDTQVSTKPGSPVFSIGPKPVALLISGKPAELSLTKAQAQDINQFVSYQSKETGLFLDYHPTKAFVGNHINSIKYYNFGAVPQTIGTLVCQIYSGIFNKQIAKNVLVISHGSGKALAASEGALGAGGTVTDTALERMQKTLLIQALAGETELKIITDNASRYAIVNRGFAVGIKMLKDVFEAIALNTPCLFLLEDIHLIGERRSFLISDHGDSFGDDMSRASETAFGSQSGGAGGAQAVHEKNQIYYQLSRHGITHYKKPFRGDFSLSIPTNHFSFDLFLKTRYSNNATTTISPLAYTLNFDQVTSLSEQQLSGSSDLGSSKNSSQQSNLKNIVKKLTSKRSKNTNFNTFLASSLQMATTQNKYLSSTGPSSVGGIQQNGGSPGTGLAGSNTVLLLKEQKKLQPKKVVKELPWVGLPTEQLALLPRISYSVRAKVAALADLSFSNMSAKLDMITDLLVIIDSVRGNRGFVVFATTHLPHTLDPALRRPGRFDETISIPTLPNLWNRWEFIKTSQPIITPEVGSWFSIFRNGGNAISNYTTNYFPSGAVSSGTINYLDFLNLDFIPNNNKNIFSSLANQYKTNYALPGISQQKVLGKNNKLVISSLNKVNSKLGSTQTREEKPLFTMQLNSKMHFLKNKNKTLNLAYLQMGKKLITNKYVYSLSNFAPIYNNPTTHGGADSSFALTETIEYLSTQNQYNSLYSSTTMLRNTLLGLISGKLSSSFAFQTKPIGLGLDKSKNNLLFQNAWYCPNGQNLTKAIVKQNLLSLYGIDQTWRAVTTLALSFVQKRYLYHKNLIVPKLLNFVDSTTLEEPPSPPTANLLIPAKRYENYKKSFIENISFGSLGAPYKGKVTNSIQEKIEAHTKQAYVKTIYNKKKGNGNMSPFSTQKLNLLAVMQQANSLSQHPFKQTSSANWHYQNRILKRHSNYLRNQWWNGQLTEHSAETLFLSDIDWRYTFIDNVNTKELFKTKANFFKKLKEKNEILKLVNNKSIKLESAQNNSAENQKLHDRQLVSSFLQNQTIDIVIDFPDADQHYNPKHRRWMLTSGYWSSWFGVDKKLQTEVFEHLIFECFIRSYQILDQNRELLDYSAAKFVTKGFCKEIHIQNNIRKF
jgi:SpoVK/Ycf46/Vps4 family AAA+-type ATPase